MTSVSVAQSWPAFACPDDGAPASRTHDSYRCAHGHTWATRHGIPRFVASSDTYADAFGLQWNTFRRTQLDSHSGIPLSRDRARRCIGEAEWTRLADGSNRLHVLEVGCGAGRFTEVLLSLPGAAVTSVDLSSAVEANQENFPQSDRHRIVQADVFRLPFPPRSYDVVFCLGVIQHTPNPERTIAQLYEQVRPGGVLVIDHYRYSWKAYLRAAPLFRAVLTRVSPPTGLRWTERLVEFFLPLHKAVAGKRLLRGLLGRVSPVLAYYGDLPLTDEQQREWALLDTHDWLTDRYKFLRTRDQINGTLRGLGLSQIWCEEGGNGVEARGRRPG